MSLPLLLPAQEEVFYDQQVNDTPKAEPAPFRRNGYTQRFEAEGKFGFLYADGSVRIPALYKQLPNAPQSFMIVKKEMEQGVIDQAGKILIPFGAYDKLETAQSYQIERYSDDGTVWIRDEANFPIIATKKGKVGLVNPYGKVMLPLEYAIVQLIGSQYYAAFKDGEWQVFTSLGKVACPDRFDWLKGSTYNTIALVGRHGKAGLLELPNRYLFPIEYDEVKARTTIPEFVAVKGKSAWTYNTKSKTFSAESPADGLKIDTIPVKKGDGAYALLYQKNSRIYGLMHARRGLVMPIQYDYILEQSDASWFVAMVGSKKALFDSTGRRLSDFNYEVIAASSHNPAFAVAVREQQYLLLNLSDGQPASDECYAQIQTMSNGYFNFSNGKAMALGNLKGERITDFQYYGFYPAEARTQEYLREQQKLGPDRQLVASGMLESGELVPIDDLGQAYKL